MIRTAKPEDITAIMDLGRRLLDRSPVLPIHNPLKARKALAFFMSNARSQVFVSERDGQIVGFIVGILDEYWWSGVKYATDAAFVVDPEFGSDGVWLVKKFIKWARAVPNVKYIALGISSGVENIERTGKMYERMGFQKAGGIYSWRLPEDI